jgi:hypothetical protein
MMLQPWLTRKNIIGGSAVLAAGLVVAGFFLLRKPPRVAMDRYIPSDALAFAEIDSLSDLADGITGTKAWRELAPVLGLSSQLRQVGLIADLIGRSGLGPDEAVLLGRAQFAIAVTGIESKSGETEDSAYIHLKPDFTLIIETHLKAEIAARIVRERGSMIAQRLYGEKFVEQGEDYRGSQLLIFQGPEAARRLVISNLGSVILIANQTASIKPCLDAISGRSPCLGDDPALKQMRPEVGREGSVFAYVSPPGIDKVLELWPVLIADPGAETESISLFADLIEHVAKQAGASLFYSLEFAGDGVTEKYLTVLRPQVAEALSQPLKAASPGSFESLKSIPRTIESLTLLNVERAGELPERVFKSLSPTMDIVAGVALREFIIGLRKQYGLEPADSVGDAIGSEIALVNFGDGQPRVMFLRVTDRSRLAPFVNRYLARKGARVTTERDNGTDVMVAANDDRRAAGFVGDFLVLGTRDQMARIIAANGGGNALEADEPLRQVLATRPQNASIVSYRPGVENAGKLLLAISKVMRVTDGSRELLERDSARKALARLPPSITFTEFRSYGVYAETHSATGSLGALASLIGSEDQ